MPDYGRIKEQIDDIQGTGLELSQWERNFIRSVIGQFKQRGWISQKQIDIVNRIHSEKVPKDS
jgi:hypothetical protein